MNLYLIGYRGSGKSTVASIAAEQLGRVSLDSDDLIENRTRHSIKEIFASLGEAGFRRIETEVIGSFRGESKAVIALGGGAILAEANRNHLKNTGKLVWLKASAETLWSRIENDPQTVDRRPALSNLAGMEEVKTVLGKREPIYAACADYTIEVGELPAKEIAEDICRWWRSVDKSGDGPIEISSIPRPVTDLDH